MSTNSLRGVASAIWMMTQRTRPAISSPILTSFSLAVVSDRCWKTITGEYRNAQGAPCKRFTRTMIVDNQTYITDGTACRQPNGIWAVGELRPRNDGQPVKAD